ncbi:hypothetical protein M426DRAFT_239607 [Hypoxylon sp. CI-4A]|nr:hypothetical protein M426DRAFT_239607 [Hypoxylon sp. CI-4A]
MLEHVQPGPPDPMYHLKVAADSDTHQEKVDLGVGVYRNEHGQYHELQAVKQAKQELATINPGHDYGLTTGDEVFLANAQKILFGKQTQLLSSGRIASVQTIAGTGANHLGASLVKYSNAKTTPSVYFGTPAWGNYDPLWKLVGLETKTYNHYNRETGEVDFDSVISAAKSAPEGSVFILQACCHNPTAADFSQQQWQQLAEMMKAQKLFPFFDIAYQGLGQGLDEDAYGVRLFADLDFEMIVCQSFSKNFGLYGERLGVLHVVSPTAEISAAVRDRLRSLIRWEYSSSPAYSSRLVNLVLSKPEAEVKWQQELAEIRGRLQKLRSQLYHLLNNVHKTPGNWELITRGNGLFSLLPLTPEQSENLQERFHIFLVSNGRINVSGLSDSNIEYAARSIDAVVRDTQH